MKAVLQTSKTPVYRRNAGDAQMVGAVPFVLVLEFCRRIEPPMFTKRSCADA